MALTTFSVVVVGESFPVQSIRTEDFSFRHRELKETMRVPVALQAENAFVTLQILPERFELSVKNADHVTEQVAGVTAMLGTFLEYVGRRTITALGHNAKWTVQGSAERKQQLVDHLTRRDALTDLVGPPIGTDVVVKFSHPSATFGQATVVTSEPGDAVLNFNFHYDFSSRLTNVQTAIDSLPDVLSEVQTIGARADQIVTGVKTS